MYIIRAMAENGHKLMRVLERFGRQEAPPNTQKLYFKNALPGLTSFLSRTLSGNVSGYYETRQL